MKIDFKLNITTLLLILAVGFVALKWNGQRNETNRWEHNYEVATTEFETYKIEIDGTMDEMIVSHKAAIQLTEKELKDALKSDSLNKELARHYKHLYETVEVETVFVTEYVEKEVPITVEEEIPSFVIPNDCYTLDLRLSNGLIGVNDIDIQNKMSFVSGDRKLGWFKTEYSVDIANTNPCITTTGVTSYKVVHQPKLFERPSVWGIAGFIAGFIIGDK